MSNSTLLRSDRMFAVTGGLEVDSNTAGKIYQSPYLGFTEPGLTDVFALSLVPEGEGVDLELEEYD